MVYRTTLHTMPEWSAQRTSLSSSSCRSPLKMLQLLQVTPTACCPFVSDQVVERNEVDRKTEKCAWHSIVPRFSKSNPADVGQDCRFEREQRQSGRSYLPLRSPRPTVRLSAAVRQSRPALDIPLWHFPPSSESITSSSFMNRGSVYFMTA